MSKTIFEETKRLPAITSFWGGSTRGKCIQLTKMNLARHYMYFDVRVKDIGKLILRLKKAKGGVK